eukprot:CAMPEP_0114254798 /NCGR_PEP_ID=MMETSP0058-20121206/17197_1 /TAXON_ID=36894 /ORGANISM="Pyramimonas parkeae, CCMP726" /LENGTH=63 /DNA_ID=CAMNT_0001369093 /DNA_START=174 /DNA_END=365 /DNA_ORIENTATION=+
MYSGAVRWIKFVLSHHASAAAIPQCHDPTPTLTVSANSTASTNCWDRPNPPPAAHKLFMEGAF